MLPVGFFMQNFIGSGGGLSKTPPKHPAEKSVITEGEAPEGPNGPAQPQVGPAAAHGLGSPISAQPWASSPGLSSAFKRPFGLVLVHCSSSACFCSWLLDSGGALGLV